MRNVARSAAVGVALGWLIAIAASCIPPKTCGPDSCAGCCDAEGACQSGSLDAACGLTGAACATCTAPLTCSAGACVDLGGGGGGGGGADGGTVSFNSWCTSWATATCEAMVACGEMDAAQKAGCVALYTSLGCLQDKPSILKGYVTLDATVAQACLTAATQRAQNCAVDNSICSGLTEPRSTAGQGCYLGSDCADEGYGCGGSAACSLTCQPGGALNQPCRSSYPSCDLGLWCDSSAAPTVCRGPVPLGSACRSDSPCGPNAYCDETKVCAALPGVNEPCHNGYQCGAGLYCKFASAGNTCQAKVAVGNSCSGGEACVETAYCAWQSGTGTSVCTARLTTGAACTYDSQCAKELRCEGDTCQPRATEGQSCADYSDCAESLSCDRVTSRCGETRWVANGESCTGSTLRCDEGNCRGAVENPDGGVGTLGTCFPPALGDNCTGSGSCPLLSYCQLPSDGGWTGVCTATATGSPCDYDQNCPATDYCGMATSGADDKCTKKAGLGQPCETEEESCTAPYICKGAGTTGVCGERASAGQPCSNDSECKVFHECLGGTCVATGLSGQPCYRGVICYDGVCSGANPDAGVAGTCGGKAPAGEACLVGSQCQSGSCLGNLCQSCP